MPISIERLRKIVHRFRERKIAVFGDIVADIYVYGKPYGLSREAPVLVVRHDGERIIPGSAGNTIRNLSELGVRVFPISVLADDEPGKLLREQFSGMNVQMDGVLTVTNRTTTTKTRIMAGDDHTSKQQVIRIDREVRESLPKAVEKRLAACLRRISDDVEALIVSDYGYGLVTPTLLNVLQGMAAHKTVVVDSRHHLRLFSGVTAITPNESEAEAACQEKIATGQDAIRVGRKLLKELGLEAVLITRGNKGMVLTERSGDVHEIPICGTDEITDVTGAGDTVAAVFTASIAGGASFHEAAKLSNYAGGVVVMKRGAAVASPGELVRIIERDDAGGG